eukprot:2121938-Prymnesium_polylepis.1
MAARIGVRTQYAKHRIGSGSHKLHSGCSILRVQCLHKLRDADTPRGAWSRDHQWHRGRRASIGGSRRDVADGTQGIGTPRRHTLGMRGLELGCKHAGEARGTRHSVR